MRCLSLVISLGGWLHLFPGKRRGGADNGPIDGIALGPNPRFWDVLTTGFLVMFRSDGVWVRVWGLIGWRGMSEPYELNAATEQRFWRRNLQLMSTRSSFGKAILAGEAALRKTIAKSRPFEDPALSCSSAVRPWNYRVGPRFAITTAEMHPLLETCK